MLRGAGDRVAAVAGMTGGAGIDVVADLDDGLIEAEGLEARLAAAD